MDMNILDNTSLFDRDLKRSIMLTCHDITMNIAPDDPHHAGTIWLMHEVRDVRVRQYVQDAYDRYANTAEAVNAVTRLGLAIAATEIL